MAGNQNPNEPAAVGLEWMVTRNYYVKVAPGQNANLVRLRSTVAETIRRFRAFMTYNPNVTDPLHTVFEVFPAGQEFPGAGTTRVVQCRPSADNFVGNWKRHDGSATNLYFAIDDNVGLPTTPNDFIRLDGTIAGLSAYRAQFDVSAIPANARILKLRIVAVDSAQPSPTLAFRDFFYRVDHIPSGTVYIPPGGSYDAGLYAALRRIDLGEINPQTGNPWTRADLTEFGPAGDWAIRVEAVGDPNVNPVLHSLALEVHYLETENRVAAAGYARPTTPSLSYALSVPCISLPSGAADWAKPASGDWSVMWRHAIAPLVTRTGGPLADDLAWHGPAAVLPGPVFTPPPVPGLMSDSLVARDQYGVVSEPTSFVHTNAPTMGLERTDGQYSNDSQPYILALSSILSVTPTNPVAAQRVRQTSGATQGYLTARFVVTPPVSDNSTLTVTVHRVSDGGSVGGSLVLTAATARALPIVDGTGGTRIFEGLLSSAASLVSGTQYEIRFTRSGGGTQAWHLNAPETGVMVRASYRGDTDTARVGAVVLTNHDIAAVLLIQPAAPATVTATKRSIALDGDADYCEATHRDVVDVAWSASTLGAGFARYEVQRLDPDGEWRDVATEDTLATVTWTDNEGPRDRAVRYRVRSVATTGAYSAWTQSGEVTAESHGPHIVFTSNAEPSLTVVYDHEPRVRYDFHDHDGDQVVVPQGDDGVRVFQDPRRRGVGVRYDLIVNFKGQPTDAGGDPIDGEDVFAPLLRIATALGNRHDEDPGPIPYVAVLAPNGRVTYGYVRLGDAEQLQPAHRYACPVTIRPLTFTPTPAEN